MNQEKIWDNTNNFGDNGIENVEMVWTHSTHGG